jgi:hypothetical protein
MTWADEVLADGAELLWKFDETSGSTIVDYSGNDRDGFYQGPVIYDVGSIAPSGEGSSITGLVGPTVQEEIAGYLASADGLTSGYLAKFMEIALLVPETIPDGWVGYAMTWYSDDSPSGTIAVGKDPSFGATGAIVLASGYSSDFMTSWSVGGTITPGEPFLLALEWDGAEVSMYVNGEPAVSPIGDYPSSPAAWTLPGPLNGLVGGPGINQGHQIGGFALMAEPIGATRIGEHYEAWAAAVPPTFAFGRSSATAEIELSLLDFVFSDDTLADASSSGVAESDQIVGHYFGGAGKGRTSTVAGPWARTLEIEGSAPMIVEIYSEPGYVDSSAMLIMTMNILDDELARTPNQVPVVISNGPPAATVEFTFDDDPTVRYTTLLNDYGATSMVSVPVHRMDPGEHVLHAKAGAWEAQDDFTVLFKPTTPKSVGVDATPVEVPGALNADGSRNWVLQDLMPGGLGSYVMPRNPVEMDRALVQRELAAAHTTSPSGQHHIFEGNNPSFEWTFNGICFTQEDQEILYAYLGLNHRFYLIDHRNRAWVTALTDVQIVPRLRSEVILPGDPYSYQTDWLAEYTVTAIAYEDEYRTPIPLEGP